jgi:hypothetical protein
LAGKNFLEGKEFSRRGRWKREWRQNLQGVEAIAKVGHFVIKNDVKDLNLIKIRDSSQRSE